jgi:hypothetical protein
LVKAGVRLALAGAFLFLFYQSCTLQIFKGRNVWVDSGRVNDPYSLRIRLGLVLRDAESW